MDINFDLQKVPGTSEFPNDKEIWSWHKLGLEVGHIWLHMNQLSVI